MHCNKYRGFTLVEVLIALAILAIALAATMRATSMATVTAQTVKMKTYATWVAENRLAEITALQIFPSVGMQNGETMMAGIAYKWTQTTNETPNKDFRKVEMAVSLPNETQKVSVLVSYVARSSGSK
jgi:general secretion pathway protein I